MEQILLISVVILILFGPEKLPTFGKALGTLLREFQTAAHPETAAPVKAESPAQGSARRKRPRKPKTKAHLTAKTLRTTKEKTRKT